MRCETCGEVIVRVQRGALAGWQDSQRQFCCPGTNTPHRPGRGRTATG
jgi:hypothetical protein